MCILSAKSIINMYIVAYVCYTHTHLCTLDQPVKSECFQSTYLDHPTVIMTRIQTVQIVDKIIIHVQLYVCVCVCVCVSYWNN